MSETGAVGDPTAEPDSPASSRYMLALFDVLGFSARLEQQGLDAVLVTYRKLIEEGLLEPARRCLGTALVDGGGRVMTLFVLPVRYAYFSDTLMLWVPLERIYAGAFVARCADLMCKALEMGVPLRGAISTGEAVMHSKTNTFLGAPVVEAARLEQGQEWMGLTLGSSATWPLFVAELEGPTIIEYNVPMKAGFESFASPIAVDWPRVWRDKQSDGPEKETAALNADPRFTRYYDNAIAFAQHSAGHHDWFKRPDEIPKDAKLRLLTWEEFRGAEGNETPCEPETRQ